MAMTIMIVAVPTIIPMEVIKTLLLWKVFVRSRASLIGSASFFVAGSLGATLSQSAAM